MQPCKSVVVDVTTLLQVVITLHEVDISSTLYSMFLQLATPVAMLFNLQVITMLCYSLKGNAACISHPLFVTSNFFMSFCMLMASLS